MQNTEARVVRLETKLQGDETQLQQLIDAVAALQQQQYAAAGGQSGSSGSSQCFFTDGLNLAGATGTLPSITLASPETSIPVYQIISGTAALYTGGATVYNPMPDATDPTMRQILTLNPDGTFSVTGQSCTAP